MLNLKIEIYVVCFHLNHGYKNSYVYCRLFVTFTCQVNGIGNQNLPLTRHVYESELYCCVSFIRDGNFMINYYFFSGDMHI